MKGKWFKTSIIMVSLILAASSVLTGCGEKKVSKTSGSGNVKYNLEGTYPMESEDTLTVWGLAGDSTANSLGDTPFGKKWCEETGVKVEFQQPTVASASSGTEALNLLVASGDLPDILVTNLSMQPGGVGKYADDNIIIELNDLIEQYAPNLRKYLDDNKDIDKIVKSDSGKYFMFPFVRGDEILTVSSGLAIRKDLLDKGGLPIPETIDQWHDALTYFKEQGADAPLSYDFTNEKFGLFMGAYGVKNNFFVVDGKVKYGFLEDGMVDALKNFKQWYDEGLLDKNIVKVADLDSNILTGETCASFMWAGSGIGKYINAMKDKNPEFNLVATKYPVLKQGDTPMFGTKEFRYNVNSNAFITSACTNTELAARFLDYGYSEKGHMLFNFGIEGESYNMVDGYPTYTDIITKNPEGLSMSSVMSKYMRSSTSGGPFVQDKRYIEQYYFLEQQKDALDVWAKTSAPDYNIPIVSFTAEESQELSSIMNNVKTYTDEMVFKYIMGMESLDNYDALKRQIKDFGIDKAIAIYEAAIGRYNSR